MYPHFYAILSRIIRFLARSNSPLFAKQTTVLLFKLLAALNSNPDLSEDERGELLQELLECMRKLAEKGVPLDRDRLRRGVERVQEGEIKQQMLETISAWKEAKLDPQI
jgi:hypothetical protein